MTRMSGSIGFSKSAAEKWAASSGVFAGSIGNVGCRIYGGRMAFPNMLSSVKTFELLIGVPVDVEAVQIVFANGYLSDASATASVYCMAAGVPSPDVADMNAAAWVQARAGGNANCASLLSPATAAQNRKIGLSDWINVQSVPRNDGGAARLIAVRAQLSACNLGMLNNATGTQDFTNWAAHPSGRIVRWREQSYSGGVPANASGWTSTVDVSGKSPLVGIRYMTRGKVINVAGFGDSITEGQGSYIGEGFGFPACVELTNEDRNGIAYEWSNLGWAGVSSPTISNLTQQAIADGLTFNAALMPVGSPNDMAVPILASNIAAARGGTAIARAALAAAKIPVIPWTVIPVSPSVKDWNGSDSLRRDLNAAWRGAVGAGQMLMDFDAVAADALDGDGQMLPKAGFLKDGIHPGDAGNALLVPLVKKAIARTVGMAAGKSIAA